ncbi:ABC transporter substrate-binding protein [Paraburkholderia caballeronis]|uniref:ABC-type nitrate/sulfonate/bicarbonate transport system, substrate-binding protein n=1 Tax=Paraburkholderia caballeronis TaxID=416943 RepID=A0A1H7JKN6_9BURK|nr:ABC transporter substrate-binding protein [Paraburkholderia caballeronis]PXW27378.1 ABC-type nitrate/sulfonate/bicarbonate transport system substrate-binding protein [Paraburkholderia caballeronis]PXX02852.1 ABC-type nitrate/sulfonate/bicarbonate transport system substrate-binding protein [Paraburkholderia caballeronis]RAK03577.1 ABC-type nitrate/sulfonate/bicarbonate transport system substrate-binding protein [Paraburkholderia caballeronis]SEC32538.1 ABC-type nitrate/sulfonate/bicarbonate t
MTDPVRTFFTTRRRVLGFAAAAPLAAAAAALHSQRAYAADLSGAMLVLGDQAGGLRALVEAAKVLDGAPYGFRWANFQGAAPLFEAQRAGAVDLAPAGDLPVLAAAAGDPDMKIVATRAGVPTQLGILVRSDSSIRRVADLKGRTVFVSSARGSISQYQLYGALAEAGLSKDDVSVRFILPVDAFAAFASGSIEVWATFDPYYGIAAQRGGRVLRDGTGINSGLGFITASGAAVADTRKRAAIADVLVRFQRAGDWALANPDAYAQVYATLTRTPPEAAKQITARSALKQRFVTDADIAALQQVADTAFREAILPRRIDVRAISDTHIAAA